MRTSLPMGTRPSITHRIRSAVSARRGVAAALAVTAAASLTACLSLEVTDPNGLGINTVFNNASNTDAALIGSWKAYTENNRLSCPTIPLSIWGNDNTSTSVTYLDYTSEPRIPINNRDNVNCVSRYEYYVAYEAGAAAREAYQGIKANGLRFGVIDAASPEGRDTPSRLIFSKFIHAMSQLRLGLNVDQANITEIETPTSASGKELTPYKDVLAHSIKLFRDVIKDANAAPNFTLPTTFINGRAITRDELVRISQSFITRAEVYGGRTVAERNAVNWAAVLARLDSGIIRDFGHQADPAIAGTGSTYINNSFAQNTLRINNRLLGPADTSGQYQAWLAKPVADRGSIIITTPDRRIHAASGNGAAGTRFIRQTTPMGSATLAPYATSWYRSTRYLTTAADSGNRAFIPHMTIDEMKFVRAEALYRLGRGAEAAALINPTRIAAGLKPVDANGPPAGRDCVPRKNNGDCGDLFDAIQYEKRIELYPMDAAVSWYDQRGWGKLVPGTPVHSPVSGRELVTLGLPYYTFGGSGAGSAQ